jgi:predicted transcriptional regulator
MFSIMRSDVLKDLHIYMDITIPDDLNRRLEQLAKGTGQNVGALVCEAIEQRLALEEGKKPPQETSAWQAFSAQDPFMSLIGSFEDEASDVSQKKYDYLADTYCP